MWLAQHSISVSSHELIERTWLLACIWVPGRKALECEFFHHPQLNMFRPNWSFVILSCSQTEVDNSFSTTGGGHRFYYENAIKPYFGSPDGKKPLSLNSSQDDWPNKRRPLSLFCPLNNINITWSQAIRFYSCVRFGYLFFSTIWKPMERWIWQWKYKRHLLAKCSTICLFSNVNVVVSRAYRFCDLFFFYTYKTHTHKKNKNKSFRGKTKQEVNIGSMLTTYLKKKHASRMHAMLSNGNIKSQHWILADSMVWLLCLFHIFFEMLCIQFWIQVEDSCIYRVWLIVRI